MAHGKDGMTHPVEQRLSSLLGPGAVGRDQHGLPRAIPGSGEALALVCRAVHEAGWRFRLEGRGTWLQPDTPADLVLSTRGLTRIVSVSPADLVATVEAGVTLEALHAELARHRLWLALDPPGRPDRSIGSVAATGTGGPLRHGFGPVRDHVLGCTVCTGDGRLVAAGGRVVKNVAGYDLTKLHLGGFGGFGVIAELHLRLRAEPAADVTLVALGGRHELVTAGLLALQARVAVVALELVSPALAAGPNWALAARVTGTPEGVEAEAARLASESGLGWQRLTPERAAAFWSVVAGGALGASIAIRLGGLLDGLDDLIDLVQAELGEGVITAGVGTGALRWVGEADVSSLLSLRRQAAQREVPVTLERGPWQFRRAVGHFGAYREGVGVLVERLRETFDPGRVIAVTLEGEVGSGR
jgi:FAD/FMN-containing dehydrogenase